MRNRIFLPLALLAAVSATEARGQVSVELSWGADRNVDSGPAVTDGWLNGTVEWIARSGLGLGIGADLQFGGLRPAPSRYYGGALYFSSSYEPLAGRVAPFLRGGLGLGRAPCEGDTCGGGLYLRGSGGLRVRVTGIWRITGEIGVSRVSQPFGGLGVSLRL